MNIDRETKPRYRQTACWLRPVLLALPMIGILVFAAAKWGTVIKNLIHVVIKMAVISL